jgi:hypothetical protein
MGNIISDSATENISQTQITAINQKCNQSVSARVENVQITAIDSHIGNIDLSATVNVGDLNCVLAAVAQAVAQSAVENTSIAQISALPFQANINTISVTDVTDIQSYQQSIIDQSCVQTVTAEATNIVLTFIDSSTGNIKIGAAAQITSSSCNLQASSYQSAAATVKDLSEAKITSGCCAFDLGMAIPLVLGLIGLVVVTKMAMSKKKGGPATDTTGNLIAQLGRILVSSGGPPQQSSMGATPPSAATAGTRARVVSVPSRATVDMAKSSAMQAVFGPSSQRYTRM